MIEPMTKAVIICLRDHRERALAALRDLAVLHVQPVSRQESPELTAALRQREHLERLLVVLQERRPSGASAAATDPRTGAELFAAGHAALNEETALRTRLDQLRRFHEQLEPWGDFDRAALAALTRQGLTFRLCCCPAAAFAQLTVPEHAVCQVVATRPEGVYFVIVSDRPVTAELPDAALPELPLAEVRAQIAAAESRLQAIDQQLRDLARALPRLTAWREDLAEGSELLTVRDGMGEAQTLLYLEGYVPARTLPELRAAAAAEGWGLRLETPADDDTNVPTLLRIPRWLQLSTPLLSFIGIQPGYREFDISACFLLFFSIFCGMIVGDAGYGLLMLVTTLIVRSRLQPEQRPAANLFLLLSGCVMTWGLLTGAFFGIPAAHLPFFMHGVPWCRELRNIQFLCFLLGAIHLTIAHGWKGLVTINSLSCLSHLGWTLIIWGNFFVGSHLVTERPYPSFGLYFYYVGVVLVLAFTDPSRKLLKSFGAGLSAILLGGMNSFVDVLSYIRLFAVGLSGAYMASSFNDMGLMVAGSPVGIVLMLGVFAFGHALNLALSALGVLVHGIRLNTLEFSGHIGIEWAGIPFHAFARRRGAAPDGTPGATTS